MAATRLAVAGAALLTAVVLGPAGTDTLGAGWGRPVAALVALTVAAVALRPLAGADRWWKQDQADLERLAEPLVWPVQLGRHPVVVHRLRDPYWSESAARDHDEFMGRQG